MSGELAKIYSSTLTAQVGMQRLADELRITMPAPQRWNEIEEELECALDRFRAFRQQCRSERPQKPLPPGLAGV